MTKMKLANHYDLKKAEEGLIPFESVRSVEVDAIADTGAIGLAFPEDVAEALGVTIIRYERVKVADGRWLPAPIVSGVFLEVLGRTMSCDAFVLPRGTQTLLGAIQLEWLDLVVVPKTQEVIPNPAHPDGPEGYLLRAS